jgi:indole-3-glycerol phosphate synthase
VILDEILAHKRRELAERRERRPLGVLEAAISLRTSAIGGFGPQKGGLLAGGAEISHEAAGAPARSGTVGPGGEKTSGESAAIARPCSFLKALRQPGVAVIAEFKRKSPSGGELRPGASAADMATLYMENGAAALSVLTDETYFGGADDDLVQARAASGLPVLRKDFVVDAYQVYEARAIGADAVLLIVRALTDADLQTLLALAHTLHMQALVETHSAEEVRRALDAGARVIGVNNRDLDTLQTDVSLAPRLRPLVPQECVFVAESGVSTPEQIAKLLDLAADAVLVGESLLRSNDPGELLRRLVAAGTPRGVHA